MSISPVNTTDLPAINFEMELLEEQNGYELFKEELYPLVGKIFGEKGQNPSYFDKPRIKKLRAGHALLERLQPKLKELSQQIADRQNEGNEEKLLEAEKEFEVVRKEINECKSKLIEEVRYFEPKAKVNYELLLAKAEMTTKSAGHELGTIDAALTQIRHPKHRTKVDIKEQIRLDAMEVKKALSEHFVDWSSGVEHLNISQSAIQESVQEVIAALQQFSNCSYPMDIDRYTLHFHENLQQCDQAVYEALFQQRNRPEVQQTMNDITLRMKTRQGVIERYRSFQNHGQLVDRRSLTVEHLNKEVPVLCKGGWQHTLWGRLLIPEGTIETMKSCMGAGFAESIDALKREKKEIRSRIKTTTNEDPMRTVLEKREVDVKRAYYSSLLTRMVDVIGDKEWELRQIDRGKVQATDEYREMLIVDLNTLNDKFDRVVEKYRHLPEDSGSLLEAWKEDAKNKLLSYATLGYYNGKSVTYEEFLQKKHYADLGYSMNRYIEDWINDSDVSEQKDMIAFFKSEVRGFMEWAVAHPDRASTMVGDMTLTIAMIAGDDKTLMHDFNQTMKGTAYTRAFLAPLGSVDWEPLETEKELKYRALADLCRYAPIAAGAGSGVIEQLNEGNVNPIKLLAAAAKGAGRARLVQFGADLVPGELKEAATAVASIAEGQDIREVLETQRNFQLARIGGVAANALISPKGFAKKVRRRAALWLKTMEQCKVKERLVRAAVQVGTPAVAAAAGVGVLAVAIAGGPITLGLALGAAATFFAFGGSVIWRSNPILNRFFPKTVGQVRRQEKLRIEERAKEELIRKYRQDVEKARKEYVNDLQAVRAIPTIIKPQGALKETNEAFAKGVVDKISADLLTQLNKNRAPGDDTIAHLRKCYQIGMVRGQVEALIREDQNLRLRTVERSDLVGHILYEINERIKTQWINPNLQDEMVTRAVKRGIKTKGKISDPPDLKEALKQAVAKGVNRTAHFKGRSYDAKNRAVSEFMTIWESNRSTASAA